MIQSALQRLSFKEYLTLGLVTDAPCELVNGELIAMAQPTGQHAAITEFLNDLFRAYINSTSLSLVSKQGAIALEMPQTGGKDTARIPDICVVEKIRWQALKIRTAAIALDEPSPVLVVEVVSTNWKDNYLCDISPV